MTDTSQKKRLFFGMSVEAPWPLCLPKGRLIDEKWRHITFAFLGETTVEETLRLKNLLLCEFPLTLPKLGCVGKFDQSLFLPLRHPHVVAWHASLDPNSTYLCDQRDLFLDWLEKEGFPVDRRHGFTPHVTIARDPKGEKEWIKAFHPLPLVITGLHLFESLGFSQYSPLFSLPFLRPFEEIEHTGDVAYLIRGKNLDELALHAKTALAFFFPPFIRFFDKPISGDSLETIIRTLNQMASQLDIELGCPFKAISYHSKLKTSDELQEWEMIIDV